MEVERGGFVDFGHFECETWETEYCQNMKHTKIRNHHQSSPLLSHIVYNYDKWPINFDKSYVFPYLEKGSSYLIKEFPNEKTYQDSKEKITDL